MYETVFEKLALCNKGNRLCICIDGMCGSGKTVLSSLIHEKMGGNLVHIDYFYLPFNERRSDWKEIPAGNMDLVRFRSQVLQPYIEGKDLEFWRFDQFRQQPGEHFAMKADKILIVDGSYSMHPSLSGYYDFKIFMKCSAEAQEKRLKEREGDHFSAFSSVWIERELEYHKAFSIEKKADIIIDTTELF